MKYLFSFLMLLVSTSGFSTNDVPDWFFEQASGAIKKVGKNRVYLHCSRICISDDCINLINDFNELIPLTFVFSSPEGLYVPTNMFNIFNMWKCPVRGCGYWNHNDTNICQNCLTPREETERR